MGSPELRSLSHGLCVGRLPLHPQRLRAVPTGPSPLSVGRCCPSCLQWRLESSPTGCPCGPSGLPSLWVLSDPRVPPASGSDQVPVCRAQWPRSPGSTSFPLPHRHPPPTFTRVAPGGDSRAPRTTGTTRGNPTGSPTLDTEAPFAQSSPEGHSPRNFTLPQPSPRMCLRGRRLRPGPEPLLLLKVAQECGLDPRLRLSEGRPRAAHAGRGQPPP